MIIETPFGSYDLIRNPEFRNDNLRAWDAADEYLLSYLAEQGISSLSGKRVLLVNDQFGGLSLPLHEAELICWNDSFLSHQGITSNYQRNGLESAPQLLPSTEAPTGHYDLILIKVPKTLAFLEYQLAYIATLATPQTQVIAAGMAKEIHSSTLKLFEQYLGATTTSLARKKARLILPQGNVAAQAQPPSPELGMQRYSLPPLGFELSQQANVFSREKLDIGARFFIEQFEQLPQARHIVDMGCGNGVLSLVANHYQPQARLTLMDESYMAIASARQNLVQAADDIQAEFLVGDALQADDLHEVDLILCNPPFHQGQAINDRIAKRMFKQSHRLLAADGELWVVANRHLPYKQTLKRLFGQVQQVAQNNKFVVLRAVK